MEYSSTNHNISEFCHTEAEWHPDDTKFAWNYKADTSADTVKKLRKVAKFNRRTVEECDSLFDACSVLLCGFGDRLKTQLENHEFYSIVFEMEGLHTECVKILHNNAKQALSGKREVYIRCWTLIADSNLLMWKSLNAFPRGQSKAEFHQLAARDAYQIAWDNARYPPLDPICPTVAEKFSDFVIEAFGDNKTGSDILLVALQNFDFSQNSGASDELREKCQKLRGKFFTMHPPLTPEQPTIPFPPV